MGLLGAVVGKLKSDLKAIPEAISGWWTNSQYKIARYREGKVSLVQLLAPVIATAGGLVLVAALLFPVYWIFLAAISGGTDSLYSTSGIQLLPEQLDPEPFMWVIGDLTVPNYQLTIDLFGQRLFVELPFAGTTIFEGTAYTGGDESNFVGAAWNSLVVSTVTVLVGMSVVVPGAYAFSRKEFILRGKALYGYILFTQVGGGLGIAVLIALYAIFVEAGNATGYPFVNNRVVLGFYYAALAVPFNTWLLKTFMDSIPPSYEEAAVIDGAPPWRVVYEIILPLSKAGLAAVFIFVFLSGWTEFVVAQTVLRPENYTLPVELFALVGEYSTPWARFSAFALTFAAPIMIIYLFAQRYIEGGLSFGGMEG